VPSEGKILGDLISMAMAIGPWKRHKNYKDCEGEWLLLERLTFL
jgi:hypothetical protein